MSQNTSFSEESLRRIAKQKVNYRLALRIHFAVFFLTNIMLVAINLLTSNRFYWFIFPLFGWFIGLVMHAISYSLYARGVYPMAKRGVILHFFAWFTVNLLLFAIDFELWDRLYFHSITWAYYPAIFWFVAFLFHAIVFRLFFSGIINEDGVGKTRREKAIDREMQKMQKN